MENTRIIIICKCSNDNNKGLLKIIEPDSPFVLDFLYTPKGNLYESKISINNPFLYLSADKIDNKPFENWNILILSDQLAPKDYPDIFNNHTLVMFHNTPLKIEDFLNGKLVKGKKKGMHEPSEPNGYPLINLIIDAYSPLDEGFDEERYKVAMDKIIKWFDIDEVLEYKLELLHQCLNPTHIFTDTQIDKLGILIDDSKEKERIKQLMKNYSPKEDHFGQLVALRDGMLSVY